VFGADIVPSPVLEVEVVFFILNFSVSVHEPSQLASFLEYIPFEIVIMEGKIGIYNVW
jgi:hypothetical protein